MKKIKKVIKTFLKKRLWKKTKKLLTKLYNSDKDIIRVETMVGVRSMDKRRVLFIRVFLMNNFVKQYEIKTDEILGEVNGIRKKSKLQEGSTKLRKL